MAQTYGLCLKCMNWTVDSSKDPGDVCELCRCIDSWNLNLGAKDIGNRLRGMLKERVVDFRNQKARCEAVAASMLSGDGHKRLSNEKQKNIEVARKDYLNGARMATSNMNFAMHQLAALESKNRVPHRPDQIKKEVKAG